MVSALVRKLSLESCVFQQLAQSQLCASRHFMRHLTLTSIALACSAVLASAQAPQNALHGSILDEVVVTATRTERTVFEVPYTAHVIGREDFIERRNVRTLPDALSEIPGVMV